MWLPYNGVAFKYEHSESTDINHLMDINGILGAVKLQKASMWPTLSD